MKLGCTKANPVQGPLYQGSLAIFEARRDFRHQDITVEELRIAIPDIVDISCERTIKLSLLPDTFHGQECCLCRVSQNLLLLIRKTTARQKTQTFRRERIICVLFHPVTSRNSRTISSSASFRSASISSKGRSGVYR